MSQLATITVDGVVYKGRSTTVQALRDLLTECTVVSRDPKHIELEKLKAPPPVIEKAPKRGNKKK